MDTKVLVILAIVVILGGGAFFFLNNNQSGEAMMEKEGDAMMEKKDESSMMEKPVDVMMSKGSYEPYAASKLAMAEKGDVVLFFRASWCPTCRALDADIRAHLGDIPSGVTILEIDYDNSTALKQKYGVTHQHTLVQVGSAGNLITKWDSSPTLASLLTKVK